MRKVSCNTTNNSGENINVDSLQKLYIYYPNVNNVQPEVNQKMVVFAKSFIRILHRNHK